MAADLTGKRILITSGPTRGPIDAVRYVSNRSSGRLGCRIALEALGRGAHVVMVAGRQSALPEERQRLRVRRVETVPELLACLGAELGSGEPPDAIVHAMAVLDYVPEAPAEGKTPSGREAWELRLVRTPKVIRRIREWAPDALLVQFKLEVGVDEEELCRAALDSLRANRADLAVANDQSLIRGEAHPALIIAPDGQVLARPQTKAEIASVLCDQLAERLT